MNERIVTSLGPDLVKRGDHWVIDLSRLRVFFGLSVLAHILYDDIITLADTTVGDVSFLYKINPGINPELHGMNISHMQVYARAGVLVPEYVHCDEFQSHLRTVLGTLQMPSWMSRLHPDPVGKNQLSQALIFNFHEEHVVGNMACQFILERIPNPKKNGEFFLRLTIENSKKANLDLKNIPHVAVDDIKNRIYIEGSTKISESLTNNIQTACHRGAFSYSEENRLHNQVFEQLTKTRLGNLDCINMYWDDDFTDLIMMSKPGQILPESKKLLLCLESDEICKLLTDGALIKVILNNTIVFIDLSRRLRVLNYSFNRIRKKISMDYYLQRMPELQRLSLQTGSLNFQGINIFLVHHITSEIISFIETLFQQKTQHIWACFVKYAGSIPPVYLDILLDIPHERLFMASLERKRGEFNVDYYTMSQQFSETGSLSGVQAVLEKKKLDYFSAMRLLAGHLFLKYCIESKQKGQQVLLIEDGGYLAPFFNQFISQDKTLNQVLSMFKLGTVKNDLPFRTWLSTTLIGSVEHTRNGYDRLLQYEKKFGSFFPSFTIAISKKKVNEESKEVARSIINSIESILYGQGMTLSGRKTMVLGAEGNIGRFLCEKLPRDKTNISEKNLIKIDIMYDGAVKSEYRTIGDVPEKMFLDTDLFIGLVGRSLLTSTFIDKLLLHGSKKNIYFASGSTKTLEYTDLIEYLYHIYSSKKFALDGNPVSFIVDRITDPQTGLDQGGTVTFKIASGRKKIIKTLYLLGDLSPINFLYYGVPAESMDMIISQLTRLCLGIVGRHRDKTLPKQGVYAVDYEVNEWAQPI